MNDEFIHPNWHVILIHYPIGLLTLGLIIELLSFLWPKGGFRTAGRWMVLLGSLLTIPAATAGIYAIHDVITHNNNHLHGHWVDLKQQAGLSQAQWHFVKRHIWLNSAAGAVLILTVISWVASSSQTRRKLYWPLLIVLLAGVGLVGTSAWYGGELVYRYGTAVEPPASGTQFTSIAHDARVSAPTDKPDPHLNPEQREGEISRKAKYFIPPLQLHLVLAGLAVAFIVGAFALTLRRMEPATASTDFNDRPSESGFGADDPSGDRRRLERQHFPGHGTETVTVIEPPTVYPGRFWVAAFVVALLTALAGAWAALGVFNGDTFRHEMEAIRKPDHLRLLIHVILGISILVLPLILAGLVRFVRAHHLSSSIFAILLLLAVAAQIWVGVLMLFDSNAGPLTGWNKESAHPSSITSAQP